MGRGEEGKGEEGEGEEEDSVGVMNIITVQGFI